MSLNQIPDFMLSDAVGGVKDKIAVLSGVGGAVEKANKSEFDAYKAETATKVELANKRDKAVRIPLGELDDDAISAITGGGTVTLLSIPQDKSVTPAKTSYFKNGKNLLDKTKVNIGYYVSTVTGVLVENVAYNASDYIPLLAGQQASFYTDASCRLAYYDAAKVFISSVFPPVVPITAPTNCAYVRYSFLVGQLDTQQFELGAVQTAYEAYKEIIPKELLEDKPLVHCHRISPITRVII